ncbi:hypothetical protein NDU88_004263 [Pleurodeles waltl]|uniref:Uncharacterized protein n=1 Tax=Pleurodeles waltl TaxID=8319 RepID=A0AAV7UIR8_PLEWA|nr:hypothetical protein NDU88_004263 [Pleurodeles waltl]
MRAASDGSTPACIRGNHPLSGITHGASRFNRSSLGDLSNSGHNGRGFLVWTFIIFLPPRGKQRQMAPKVASGSRLKQGSQERRPLDPQPPARISRNSGFGNAGSAPIIKDSDIGLIRDAAELIVDGDSTGPGRLASADSGGLLQVKTDVGGSRSLDTHKTVSCIAGGSPQASVSCVGGNGLAVASEGETDLLLHAPGVQGNVGLAQEVVTGAGYSEQVAAAAYLLPSTDPPTLACTLEAIRDFRQGREDSFVQTITSQHKQTQRDSKKARVATKQLQVVVSKVAKTCSEIGERIAAIECRADSLESDLGAVTKQAAMHETQLSDIHLM